MATLVPEVTQVEEENKGRDIPEAPEVNPYIKAGAVAEVVSDIPELPEVNPYINENAPKIEFTEESFHADAQSVADSRTLMSKIIQTPNRPSPLKQGHSFAADMARGVQQPSIETMQAQIAEQKATDPAYQKAYQQSLSDSDLTAETLDWLGTTRWNMVKTGNLAFEVGDWSDEEQVALVRLMAQYEELPVSWETTKRAAEGLATDPTTYLGLSFVLSALSKVVLKPAANAALQGLLKTTAGAGLVGGIEVGGYMGVDNVLQQKIKIDTGQQSEYDLVETAAYTSGGFVAGYTIIGGLTALVAKGAGKTAKGADEVHNADTALVDEADEVIGDSLEVVDEVIEEVDEAADATTNLVDDFADEDAMGEGDWLAEMEAEYRDELGDDDFDFLMDDVEEIYSSTTNIKTGSETVEVAPLKPTTVMPKGLAGAKPRYGYGDTQYGIVFESDTDKALYIIAGKGQSKSHGEYMRFLRGVFPDKSEADIIDMGQAVKAQLKADAKAVNSDIDGNLVVKSTFEPTKKPRRPAGEAKADDVKPKTYHENETKKMPYNVMRMETAGDVRNLVTVQAQKYLDENPHVTQTLEEVTEAGRAAAKDLAETTGGDFATIVKSLQGDVEQLRIITSRIKSTRDLHQWTFEELKRLAFRHKEVNLTQDEMMELVKIADMSNKLTPLTIKQGAEQSRVLGSRRAMAISDDSLIRGGADETLEGNTAAAIKEADAEDILPVIDQNTIDAILNGDGPIVIDALVNSIINGIKDGTIVGPRTMREAIEPKAWKKVIAEINRVRAGSMLGGLTTMTLAAVSNHFQMIYEPALEYMSRINLGLTKAARSGQLEDNLARTRALAQYAGNVQYYKQGWKTAMKAVKLGIHITDPNVTHLESSAHQVGNKFKSRKRIVYENITGYAHTVLMALDEQHKFTRSHSLAFADAIVEAKRHELVALADGKATFKEGSDEWRKFIKDDMATKFNEDGSIKSKEILQAVRMETYTEELVGPVGSAVNGIARLGGGLGSLVLPFRRAPINSIAYALQYAPLPFTHKISAKQKQILASGDKVQIAKLKARKKVGAMAIGYFWYTAESGDLTGGGPADWKMRKAWEAAGNKPYTIKVGGVSIPYEKIEPFSTIMGSVANAHYIWKMNPEKYQDGVGSIIEAVQMSVTHSILNKAYFQSINDWMKMLTGEDNKATSIPIGVATSFIPNALNQMNNDPNIREATDIMEQVQRKIAGYSEELGAQYDITGQPLLRPNDNWNLFKTADVRADTQSQAKAVFQEIFDLRIVQDKEGILGDAPRNLSTGREDFREVYDRGESESVYAKYNRFIGETIIGGMSLEDALYETINSGSYTNRPKSPYLDVDSPHVAILSKVVQRYRKRAKQRLLDESPAYSERFNSLRERKLEVKRGQ